LLSAQFLLPLLLLALFFKADLLESFQLLPTALFTLELNSAVDFFHDASVHQKTSSGFLNEDDSLLHKCPNTCECIHQTLQTHFTKDFLPDSLSSFLELFDEFPGSSSAHIRLDGDDLFEAGTVENLLQTGARLLLQEYLSETDLEFRCQFRHCGFQVVQDLDRSVAWPRFILLSFSLQDWPVTTVEVFKDESDGVASLADADSFEHTSASELFEHVSAIEVSGRELVVRLDTADVSRRRLAKGHDQRRQLGSELIRK